MQNNQKIIAIFGAGGFLGKHLMRELTKLDYRVKVATRNPYLKGYLKPLGNPGQIELFKTNIFDQNDVNSLISCLLFGKNPKYDKSLDIIFLHVSISSVISFGAFSIIIGSSFLEAKLVSFKTSKNINKSSYYRWCFHIVSSEIGRYPHYIVIATCDIRYWQQRAI